MHRKAVITGMGILAPGGNDVETWWAANCSGKSYISYATLCKPEHIPFPYAGEVKNFDPASCFKSKIRSQRYSRVTQLSKHVAQQAIKHANWEASPPLTRRPIQILLGVSMGGADLTEREIRRITDHRPIHPTVIGCVHLAPLSTIAPLVNAPCQIGVLSNTCAGGLDAIAQAAKAIEQGTTDAAIAGGADAPLVPYVFQGLESVGSLSHHPGPPEAACRPFDISAQGGVLSEGAAIVLIEELHHALARGITPLAEICGYGNVIDDINIPTSGLQRSMQAAIENSMLMPSDIDLVNAHAPGAPSIDLVESKAINSIFTSSSRPPKVTSIKGMIGNPLAAGGAIQAISTICSLHHGVIPPTANCIDPIPQTPPGIVQHKQINETTQYAMVNSHGMLGVNSSLIFKKLN